jgi:hypothetical protein
VTKRASASSGSEMRTSRIPTFFLTGRFGPVIVDDLEAALEQFREIAADLNGDTTSKEIE